MNKEFQKRLKYYFKRPFFLVNYIFFSDVRPLLEKMDYDEYWKQKKIFFFSGRYPIFTEIIEENSSVFDMGCGNGATLDYIRKKKNIRAEGVDLSKEAIEIASEKGLNCAFADISSPDFQINKEYDYIILSEVLEHVPNPEEVITKTKNKFRKLLIVSCPNIGHYMHRLRLLFGRFPIQWVYFPGEHLRFWTVKDFRVWINNLGFQVAGERKFSGIPFLREIMPNLFADSLIFLLKQK